MILSSDHFTVCLSVCRGSGEGQGKGLEEFFRRTQQSLDLPLPYLHCLHVLRTTPGWTLGRMSYLAGSLGLCPTTASHKQVTWCSSLPCKLNNPQGKWPASIWASLIKEKGMFRGHLLVLNQPQSALFIIHISVCTLLRQKTPTPPAPKSNSPVVPTPQPQHHGFTLLSSG